MEPIKASLDGSAGIAQQTLDLNNAEAARFILTRIVAELDHAPWNTAEFTPLGPDDPRAAPLVLTTAPAPIGKPVVWVGNMFVEGAIKPAVAYRTH